MLETLLRLPPAERIQLIEDAWESLAASPDSVSVPDWHRELLDERLADPSEVGSRTWDEVKASARRSTQ
jgi:putative addiction module component (TIGR02574 family)